MNSQNNLHILLDIEGLGRRAGSAVIELGAVAFSLETGSTGETFHRYIRPSPALTVDLDTLDWHARQGTWPIADMAAPIVDLNEALADFVTWCSDLGEPVSFWSWGSTYDFPILEAAHLVAGEETPWEYWQASCARTVWRLAFPDTKHDPRPHHALDDAKAAALDLVRALQHLRQQSAALVDALREAEAGLSVAVVQLGATAADWPRSSPRLALAIVRETLSPFPA